MLLLHVLTLHIKQAAVLVGVAVDQLLFQMADTLARLLWRRFVVIQLLSVRVAGMVSARKHTPTTIASQQNLGVFLLVELMVQGVRRAPVESIL